MALGATPVLAAPDNGCTDLPDPFLRVAQILSAPDVANKPEKDLCKNLINSEKHFSKGKTDKAVQEIEKLIRTAEANRQGLLTDDQVAQILDESEDVIDELINGPSLASVGGAVFQFITGLPVQGAAVRVTFTDNDSVYETSTDENGLFEVEPDEDEGTFLVVATSADGSTGTVQGALTENEPEVTLLVTIDAPGSGSIQGQISGLGSTSAQDVFVTATFPRTERKYTAAVGTDGSYRIDDVALDATVIVIAFSPTTGATASRSSFVNASRPNITVNVPLDTTNAVVNDGFVNSDFANGPDGWQVTGPATVVDRTEFFDLPGDE